MHAWPGASSARCHSIHSSSWCEGLLHQLGFLTFVAARQPPEKSTHGSCKATTCCKHGQFKPKTCFAALQERFSEFKKQVDALTQQVKGLTHDKECLRSRNELLETMMEEELKCAGGATRALTSGQTVEPTDPSSSEEVSSQILNADHL